MAPQAGKHPPRTRLELEALEGRQLPAGHIAFNAMTGVVRVRGTPHSDTVVVTNQGDAVRVSLFGGAREVKLFPSAVVRRVRFRHHGGTDRLINWTTLPGRSWIAPAAAHGHLNVAAAGALAVQQTNGMREAVGLAPLAVSPLLQQAAQAHADNLARQDRYGDSGRNGEVLDGQTLWDRAAAVGYRWQVLGETTGYNYGYAAAPQMLLRQWTGSLGHLAHVYCPEYTEMGFGIARGASGRTYGVVMFGRPA
jgi:uncharacterized protein YkwD